MLVTDKVYVVTGAGSGIGRALVLELLEQRARVAAVDMNKKALDETYGLAGRFKERLGLFEVDISDKAAVEDLPEKIIKRFNHVDALINNAGIIQPFMKLEALGYDDIKHVMDVNFYGTLYMIKTFLPHLLKRPKGHIANVTSVAGFVPIPTQAVFGASKAAVKLLSESLRSELIHNNVNVSIVIPGIVRTNALESSHAEPPKDITEEKLRLKFDDPTLVAKQIIKGIEEEKYHIFVGKNTKSMDVIHRISPERAAKRVNKRFTV